MKKIFLLLIIVGGILLLIPKFVIVADITTQLLGSVLMIVAALIVCGVALWKFQGFCDEAVKRMRQQKERELAEQNKEIIYPDLKALKALLWYCLPRVFGIVAVGVALYLAVSFSWYYILPVLKYVAYVAGVLVAILLIACALTTKSDIVEDAA